MECGEMLPLECAYDIGYVLDVLSGLQEDLALGNSEVGLNFGTANKNDVADSNR